MIQLNTAPFLDSSLFLAEPIKVLFAFLTQAINYVINLWVAGHVARMGGKVKGTDGSDVLM